MLAWQESDAAGANLVRRAREGDPRTVWTHTDDRGAFVLEGLFPERQYQAVAGGKGFAKAPLDQPIDFRAGARIEIVVERAYAAWIRLREAGRAPLRISSHLYGRRYGTVRTSDPELRRASGSSIHAMLAIASVPDSASTFSDRFYVFTSRHGRETSGPVSIDLDLPGYERSRATFEVPAFDGENPAEILVELVPLSQERAALEVFFGADSLLSDSVAVAEPVGVVRLTGTDGKPCEYAVRNRIPAAFVIADLPIGDHDWEFETLDGSFRVPPSGPGRVQIGREGGRIEVDLYELGAIDLDIRWLDGSRFRGAASIVCSPIGEAHSPARIFRCPPYQVAALVPGIYEVWVDVPRFLDRRRETARAAGVTVSVQPSRVSQAELVLGE